MLNEYYEASKAAGLYFSFKDDPHNDKHQNKPRYRDQN